VGSSESGNPICCAVASKVLDVMREERIVEHAAEMGKYAKEEMEKRFLPLPHIGSVSGLGLMLGMDIVVDKKTKATPAPGTDEQLMRRALEQGLYARVMQNRFCFAPPLVIAKEEIDEALDKLYPVLAELKLS
jgi:adenosylmethionine-8-amino-7-oxononanoate aminotransferase